MLSSLLFSVVPDRHCRSFVVVVVVVNVVVVVVVVVLVVVVAAAAAAGRLGCPSPHLRRA